MSAFTPTNKPQPILEFHNIRSRAPNEQPVQPPRDLRWLRVEEFFHARTIAPNTKKAYERELRRFVDWTDKAWNDITGRDVANYKHDLETCATDNGKQQRSLSTVAVAMTALKSFFKWMAASYYINENPTVAVTIPPQKKPQPQHLSDAEVEALYEALSYRGEMQLRDRAILAVLEHGLRAEEVSQLNVSDYDGERVFIRQAKHDSTGWVPLAPESSLALDNYLEARRQQENTTMEEINPLFLSHSPKPKLNSQRLGYDGIYKMVRDLGHIACGMLIQDWFERHELSSCLDETQTQQMQTFLALNNPSNFPQWALAYLPPQLKTKAKRLLVVHPHQLRHTFATRLVLMGIDSYLARKLTRHESESAFRRYSEYGRGVAAEAAYRQAIARKDRS
ncbi:tyrosine-type recombinase/integrase [Chroococcidiopsis sp. FACHB-1243]|uniref:tyrosine-type recombinase/integrase n=1 Tax=Chroococcidiopsis sp. [FACHB-1243] TaxID=2692781 RepID=UPI0017839C60|nr:tyrosine-type recombinase/integrase [Chroococcidiopsis sp. [FACHB-1243]]